MVATTVQSRGASTSRAQKAAYRKVCEDRRAQNRREASPELLSAIERAQNREMLLDLFFERERPWDLMGY